MCPTGATQVYHVSLVLTSVSDWTANLQLRPLCYDGTSFPVSLTCLLFLSPAPSLPFRPEPTPHATLSRVKWISTSSLLQSKRQGTRPLWGMATRGQCCGLWWSWLILGEVTRPVITTLLSSKRRIVSCFFKFYLIQSLWRFEAWKLA